MKQAVAGGSPTGAYSPGVIAEGRFVHVSGQGPVVDGRYVPGTIEEETALTLRNMERILADAGASLADVVRCGVFLRAIDDFPGMDAAYRAAFGVAGEEPLPARTTVGGQELAFGIKVEIDCIAVLAEPLGQGPRVPSEDLAQGARSSDEEAA